MWNLSCENCSMSYNVAEQLGACLEAPVLLRARLFASVPVRPMPTAGSAGTVL